MLSAEEAIEKWTEALVKELQTLPQQTATTTRTTVAQRKSGGEKVWGLKVLKKLGDNGQAVAGQGTAIPKPLEAVISKDAAPAKIAGIAVTDGSEITTVSAPAETPQPAVIPSEGRSNQDQEALLQKAAVRDVPDEGKEQKAPVEIKAALPEALDRDAASALSKSPADSAAGSRQDKTGARMPQLEALKIGSAKATATNVTRAAMKIPKDWLSKMQKK